MCFNATFYNIFSYIMTSFSGGGSRREPPTMGKQLVNFITCGCESSAPFFAIYKPRLLCNSYTCQLYIFLVLGQKLKCRALLSGNIPLKKHLTNPAVLLIYVWQDIHVYMGKVSMINHHINNVASYCCWLLAFTAKQMYKILNKQSV